MDETTSRVFVLLGDDGVYAPDVAQVEDAKRLILDYIDREGVTDIDRVYSDEAEPADLDLYTAVAQLLDEGVIVGPALTACATHLEMEYRRASTTMG